MAGYHANAGICLAWVVASLLTGCGDGPRGSSAGETSNRPSGGRTMTLTVSSSSFEEGGMIPVELTCDGADRSPSLSWSGAPPSAESFVLICDDPDAPGGDWVHWVLFDLPAASSNLVEGVPSSERLPDGGVHGRNSWGRPGYGGPCPPSGTHRYFFKVYALDRRLGLRPGATKPDVLEGMEGHVLAQGQLMGRYRRR